jgi:N-acetylglutamate synthase-like GNAT family acetyltransferase
MVKFFYPSSLPGFFAREMDEIIGLVTYNISNQGCEIITINSLREFTGLGTALLEAVKKVAIKKSSRRVWLVTTNDNLPALRFYQKRGFVISAIHSNAIAKNRLMKPEIPLIGMYGIPIRDEIEMELLL